jgi:hypothetical protein
MGFLGDFEQRGNRIRMNYRQIGMYKRPMNFFEKLAVGWRQLLDSRWEWYYHLTEAPPEMYFEFWWCLIWTWLHMKRRCIIMELNEDDLQRRTMKDL